MKAAPLGDLSPLEPPTSRSVEAQIAVVESVVGLLNAETHERETSRMSRTGMVSVLRSAESVLWAILGDIPA
jgi:hypothetical protein